MAGPHGPVGASASAYQTSPNTDGFPKCSMKTVTQRLRNAFHAIDPLCGFTSLPSADLTRACGFNSSHVAESCHASKVAGHFSLGNGLPNRTQRFPFASSQNAG